MRQDCPDQLSFSATFQLLILLLKLLSQLSLIFKKHFQFSPSALLQTNYYFALDFSNLFPSPKTFLDITGHKIYPPRIRLRSRTNPRYVQHIEWTYFFKALRGSAFQEANKSLTESWVQCKDTEVEWEGLSCNPFSDQLLPLPSPFYTIMRTSRNDKN